LALVLAVLALGLGLRLANLVDVSDSPFFTRPVIDGQVYDNWAMAIVSGDLPREPFYQDPLYPYFLALIYRVFGHSYLTVYLIQLLLGVGLLLLIYDTARRLFDRRAAIVAALIAALYKPFIFYESQIEKTALAVFLVGLFIWMLVRALGSSRLLWPLFSGITLGLAVLTRGNVLLFAPLLPVAVYLAAIRTQPGRRFLAAGLSLAGVLLVVAPVSARNSVLARGFVLTTTQAGQNLYIGNSPYNTTGQYAAPPWVRPNPEFEQADFAEYAHKSAGRELSPMQVSQFYVRAAVEWARTHSGAFARLLWRKTVLYFNNFEIPDNQDLYFFERYSWVLRLPLPGFGIVFGLGLAGMILLARRSLARLSLAVFFFGYAASVIVFFVFSRYRIPSLPALLPFAGGTVAWFMDRRTAGKRQVSRRRLAGGLALVAGSFLLTTYPVHHGGGKSEAAQCLVNLASVYYHEGDTARAVAAFEEALATRPGYGEALRNLGIIALNRHDVGRACDMLIRAAKAEPANPVTHHYLGKAFEARQQVDSACLEFRRAVDLAPGRVEYRFSLATALQQLGRFPEALAQYDTMLTLAPGNPLVHHNLAVAFYLLGRFDDARRELTLARRLGGPVNPQFEAQLRARLLSRP
jgi:Flp pilus assembly protein TadD/4-amino-4-deoxy-L-arabinose transferase-like glycosyltransferase